MKMFKRRNFFYFFLYITLLIGFFYNENSSGGSFYDFKIISKVIISFSLNLRETLDNFYNFSISHFPYYYIFLSFLYKNFGSFYLVKLSILHLSLLLPIMFYKLISIRFNQKDPYLIYIPGILFLSIYFRSSAIWALNDNLALTFFCLAIFFYYKAIDTKEPKKILLFSSLNLITLVLASYTRQYYAIFWIFFIYKFFILFNYRIILSYLFISVILSLPAINGTFMDDNLTYSFNFFTNNFFNNLILVPSIFVIYLVPIYLNKKNIKEIFYFYKKNLIFLFSNLILSIFLLYFFNYSQGPGGGIIFKIFYYENFVFLFYLAILITFLIIFHFLFSNFKVNILIFLLIIMMFPMDNVFQKYLDPLSIILIFGLFKSQILNNFIVNLKDNIKYSYLYFSLIYFGSLCYYYL